MQTVLILGASSDMAIAIAKKFASCGFAVQLAARNPERLAPVCSDIGIRFNVSCTMHSFDALDFSSHSLFFDSLETIPDVAVCVFGYLGENEKGMKDWTEAQKIIQTNYTGAVSILNIIADKFSQRKRGIIVGISSVAGDRGRQSNYLYGSAKAAFTSYLSGMRNRLFKEGVHVVTVKPGFVYTKMTEDLSLPPLLTAKPEEVADAVYNAVDKRKNTVYVKWFWRYIMLVIKSIPEFVFKKLKL